jgi:hypothetical protein
MQIQSGRTVPLMGGECPLIFPKADEGGGGPAQGGREPRAQLGEPVVEMAARTVVRMREAGAVVRMREAGANASSREVGAAVRSRVAGAAVSSRVAGAVMRMREAGAALRMRKLHWRMLPKVPRKEPSVAEHHQHRRMSEGSFRSQNMAKSRYKKYSVCATADSRLKCAF